MNSSVSASGLKVERLSHEEKGRLRKLVGPIVTQTLGKTGIYESKVTHSHAHTTKHLALSKSFIWIIIGHGQRKVIHP